jgi:hypothetical protein
MPLGMIRAIRDPALRAWEAIQSRARCMAAISWASVIGRKSGVTQYIPFPKI